MDDQDEHLLSILGVTTAKPEDIERDVIASAQQKDRAIHDLEADALEDKEVLDVPDDGDDISCRKLLLQSRLDALDQEIAAVTDGLESLEHERPDGNDLEDHTETVLQAIEGDSDSSEGEHARGVEGRQLQRALGEERLASLREKRAVFIKKLNVLEDAAKIGGEDLGSSAKNPLLSSFPRPGTGEGKYDVPKKKTIVILDDDEFDAAMDSTSGFVETERDKLIRTGVVTPFDRLKGFERRVERVSSYDLVQDRANSSIANVAASMASIAKSRPTTKLLDASELPKLAPPTRAFHRLRRIHKPIVSKDTNVEANKRTKRKRPLPEMKWRKRLRSESDWEEDHPAGSSSGSADDELDYVKAATTSSKLPRRKHKRKDELASNNFDEADEDILVEGGLRIPAKIYDNLFDYQKTGVKWLWELHCQRAGGIIADEMGLGKTIQVVAFLAALHHSGLYTPSIVICPVTLLRQWKRELHKWYGCFEVEILHDSAASPSKKSSKFRSNQGDGSEVEDVVDEIDDEKLTAPKRKKRWDALIERIVGNKSGILLTTYEQLRILREKLLDIEWGYAVLDEGHRIRNPDAEVTLVCKQLQTVHRIIMTGAPIQNKLVELWSLFDFVFPGKLGVLPIFQAQFALPIAIGGYVNATPLQVTTAYKCAVVLRDLILPYMLRRLKSDVNAQLPKKTEQVLFCSLTEEQRSAYRAFLGSSEVEQIFDGNRNSLYGIDILRKICNHPDLLDREHSASHPDYGNPERSGKLKVVAQVLDLWKNQGSRVLIFSQTQQMLDILESYMVSKEYTYRRLDGSTPVKQRMALIDEFNESSYVFVFILTTKVGGLGTNLIGANKVIIFDPDWNPSTDMQARERAWRIGQTRDVTIYRLITRGTIEEKVYHRQIYKHFLTNKILRDPQQRRFFKARDMRDLFTLNEDKHETKTETSTLFAELGDISLGNENGGAQEPQSSTSSTRAAKEKQRAREDNLDQELPGESGKKKTKNVDTESNEDDSQILKCLFEANGVHSALNHNAIESMNELEKMKVDSESAKVARQAAEAVMQSRMQRSSDNVSVPTWTGRSGSAGAPVAVRRRFGSTTNTGFVSSSLAAGNTGRLGAESSRGVDVRPTVVAGLASSSAGRTLSSTDVLARLREGRLPSEPEGSRSKPEGSRSSIAVRQRAEARTGDGRSVHTMLEPEALIERLRAFIEQNGGSVSSTRLVENFKNIVPPSGVPAFRQLLKGIALLRKEGAEARWVLKDIGGTDGVPASG